MCTQLHIEYPTNLWRQNIFGCRCRYPCTSAWAPSVRIALINKHGMLLSMYIEFLYTALAWLQRAFLTQGCALFVESWSEEFFSLPEETRFSDLHFFSRLIRFFSPMKLRWNFTLCFFHNYAYICTWMRENLKDTVLQIIITWPALWKQNIQAKGAY